MLKVVAPFFVLILFSLCLFSQPVPDLRWATYHGGNQSDAFRDMAIDKSGNIYVIGSTKSSGSISTPGSYQSANAGLTDVFIAKYAGDGKKIWATYYGGTADDIGQSIDLDAQGNIYITGSTFSSNGIATLGTHKSANIGGGDIFVAKFSTNGNRIWGTYYGGDAYDSANDVDVDNAGNVIITGWTYSAGGIATPGAFQTNYSDKEDVILAKFDTNALLIWATYYGNTGFDRGLQVETDGANNIIISGSTSSVSNFSSVGSHQSTYGGSTSDAFIGKFTSAGSRLWMTYYGGSKDEYGDALVVASDGKIFLSGSSNSPNAISTPGSYQNALSGDFDAMLVYLDSDGHRIWGTYFGGSNYDSGYRLRVGSDDGIYMTGHSQSPDKISTPNTWQASNAGGSDIFLSKFDISGKRVWSTYYGGSSNDFGYGLVLDGNNGVYICGKTEGSTNLFTPGATQITFGGGNEDGIIAKFSPCPDKFAKISFNNSPVCSGKPLNLAASGGVSYKWSGPNGYTFSEPNAIIPNALLFNSGTYTVTVTDVTGCTDTISTRVVINPLPAATVSSNNPVCLGNQLQLSASGGNSYSWSGPAGFMSSAQNPVINEVMPINTGTYTVTITDLNNCTSLYQETISANAQPIVSISSNSPVCIGGQVNLSSGIGSSYLWSGPNGFSSTSQNPIIISSQPAQSGSYTVTVTESNGCTSSSSTSLIILNLPIASPASNSPICAGKQISLMSSQAKTYIWTGPNGFTSIVQNPIIPNSDTLHAGTYILSITDDNNCSNASAIIVAINPAPNALASSNGPLCDGSQIMLSSSGGNTFSWSGPGGFNTLSQNPTLNNASLINSGTYIVTVTGQNQCTSSASTLVTISALPSIITLSNIPVCIGDTILLTSAQGKSYVWSGPMGFNSSMQNPQILNATVNHGGDYLLTVTDSLNCTASKTVTVSVGQKPNINLNGADTICFGENIKLSTTAQGLLLWSNGQTVSSITVRPIVNTKYTIIANLNGCRDSVSAFVIVKPRPVLKANPPATIQKGESLTLSISGADKFVWRPAESLSCSDCASPIASPRLTTTYCVTGSSNECTSEACVTIEVNDHCTIVLPNIVTPNDDGMNDVWCSPALECVTNQVLQIFDRWGNLLYKGEGTEVCWNPGSENFNLQNQVVVFILKIVTPENKTEYLTGDILISR